jgi:hypothetical protein
LAASRHKMLQRQYYSSLWRDAMPLISIVAQHYNTNLQRPPQLQINPKKEYKDAKKHFLNLKTL